MSLAEFGRPQIFHQKPGEEGTSRNPNWKEWYPTVPTNFSNTELGKSLYGEPNRETLQLFDSLLPPHSQILDVGGGDGRYGLPLAKMGHTIHVMDVDQPSLNRLKENAKATLPKNAGAITTSIHDATQKFPFQEKFDAVLNAGFAYLIPPDELDTMFKHMTETLKPNGLLVMEFATNRDRRDQQGQSLIGEKEYNYTHDEGINTLQRLSTKYDIQLEPTQTKTIHLETPYYLHNDLIIAHGKKQ